MGTLCGIMLRDSHMQLEFCHVLADLCSARLNDWHHVNKSIVLIILWFLAVFISTHSHFNSVHNILNVYKMSLVVNYLIANLNRTTMISFANSIISKGFFIICMVIIWRSLKNTSYVSEMLGTVWVDYKIL